MNITINVNHRIGDLVYHVTDQMQNIGIVLGYEITNLGVQYLVSFESETKVYNPLELSKEKTIF